MGLFSETFSSSQKLSCSAGVQGIKISTELRSNAVANCTRGGRQFVYPGRCGERAQPGRLRFYGRWGRGSRQVVGALGGFFFPKPREFVWGSKKFRSELHGYLKKDETDAFVPSWRRNNGFGVRRLEFSRWPRSSPLTYMTFSFISCGVEIMIKLLHKRWSEEQGWEERIKRLPWK